MKTNIFLSAYRHPENKLTYSFLSLLELLNDTKTFQFLTKREIREGSLCNIRTILGGGRTNPDGSFDLTNSTGETFSVYFENKTKRRLLSIDQVVGHLEWLKKNDLLLIITTRKSDIDILRKINDQRIIFFTWSQIATHLKAIDEPIARQFIDYGRISGEFEDLSEITGEEILTFAEYFRSNFQSKIDNIIKEFFFEVDISQYGLNLPKRLNFEWGRKGVEFIKGGYDYNEHSELTYGQFLTIAYYHNTEDHAIPFKNGIPEICAFFDVHHTKKDLIKSDEKFKKDLLSLSPLGFEFNLDNEISTNSWRLFFYRKPLTEFQIISPLALLKFTEEVFEFLVKSPIFKHRYFEELKFKNSSEQKS